VKAGFEMPFGYMCDQLCSLSAGLHDDELYDDELNKDASIKPLSSITAGLVMCNEEVL
jgi:hypothetical protein